jgi:hypothetical protein
MKPVAGSSRACTPNTSWSTRPSQNDGMAKPSMASASVSRPAAPPRIALSVPRPTPSTAVSRVAPVTRGRVTPSAELTMASTGSEDVGGRVAGGDGHQREAQKGDDKQQGNGQEQPSENKL